MPDPVVVLVEDEPQIRRFLRATLIGQGYRLFEAGTGADGLVEISSRQPDVVIIDLGLPDIDDATFKVGELQVDLLRRRVVLGAAEIRLTPIEYKLLTTLVRHAGKVVTHQQLLRDVWGPTHTEQAHYVRVYMAHLRHKLEGDPARPRYLLTEPGVGYRLAVE